MSYLNKEDQAKAAKKHYEANKAIIKERASKFRKLAKERNRKYVDDYLMIHPCIDCNETDIEVLDFDHVSGEKINNVSDGVNFGWSLKKIKAEIEKCHVRCANCHRRITKKRLNSGVEQR